MKKIILFFLLSLFNFHNSFSQNYNWITPNKTYLKMYLVEDGMFRVSKTDFTNAGINTTGLNPRTVKIFNKGVQIPIYFNGELDGSFDANDYFDFYGTKNYGGSTKTYDHNNNLSYTTNEFYNQYSDTNVYWADWGGANGIRFTIPTYTTTANYTNLFFNDLLHFEKDLWYSQGENYSTSDLRFLTTEKFRGEGWFWTSITNNQTFSDTFSIPLLYTAPQTASVKVFAYPDYRNTSIFNEHTIQVSVNGTLIATLYSNDLNKIDSTVSFSSSLLSNVTVNNVSLKYVPATGASGYINIDLFEVSYPKIFKFRNEKITANLGGTDTTSKLFKISGYNSANQINIYDVNNNLKITNSTFNSDTLKFTGKSNGKFELINNLITKKPFRIKQKQVQDLVSSSNGADYLLIYNKLFLSQAEQLRAYRQSHDNFRSVKAEIEDIYDIFNYGLEHPIAVRNFTTNVYDTWQLPKLRFICLMGRASLDPKKNLSQSAYYQNLIPTFGNPPSDGYFANFKIGTFCYYTQIGIGRLPAYYPSEAQTMVDKVIAYENEAPDDWSKNFIYVTGGGTLSEQTSHQSKSNIEINNYITPPSLSGNAHKIYRSDTAGTLTFNMKDSVKNDISRGCFFVNYRGHAGSRDWEVAMNDPNTLTNGNKLPLVLSLTCFTGENSKTEYRGFGEKFIYLNDKGAIGFVGTTGWSYSQYGNDYGTSMVATIKFDTTRRAGDVTKYAQKLMSRDSLSFSIRHTLNCYSYLGDPAVTLNYPVRPELSIKNSEYRLSNQFPSVGDNITLTVFPKNYGLTADSCKIRIQLKKDNQNYSFKDSILRVFGRADSISYNFNLDSVGTYSAVVTLDYNNWHPLENKNNNSISINIPVKNTAFVPFKPVNNSLLSSDSVDLVALNPRINTIDNDVKVITQLDTTILFNSPIIRTFTTKALSGVSTKFKTSVPVPVNNRIYYWRTNCIINNDSSGWSNIQTFVYNNIILASATDKNQNTDFPAAGSVKIYKINSNQYSQSDYNNTFFNTNGIQLIDYTANLFVRSYGSNAEEASYFSVGNRSLYIDAGASTGLNILKVKKITGNILQLKNLKMNTTTSNDSLVTFLNTFDSTHYLMLLNAAYVAGGKTLTAAAKTKLKQFGSIYCDSIGVLSYYHTWSLIGYLGATPAQAKEMYDPCCRPAPGCVSCTHWTESISALDVTFRKASGSVSNIIGPAQSWSDFSWVHTLNPNSTIVFDVYGIDLNNQQTLLLSNLQNQTFSDLSTINAYQYPKINLVAKFNIDTAFGSLSSVLNSIRVNYTAPAELTWDVNSLKITSKNSVGSELKFSLMYHNPGFLDLPGIVANVYKKSITTSNLILTDTVSYTLKSDNSLGYTNKFIIPYFRDSINMYVDLKPKGLNNEFYTYNNVVGISIKLNRNSTNPTSIQVFTDGQVLNNGDFVRPSPEIKINLSDNEFTSTLASDTTRLSLKLNDRYVPYFINGNMNPLIKILDNDNSISESNNTLYYYPELNTGTNKLSLTYHIDSDNVDTAFYDVIVSDELLVKDLYNYPNPMKDGTNFIFNLAGSVVPNKFKIKIYTVSGKLIKEIDSPVNIGYNQIGWDGKDSDGDFIANGTYLYRLVTEDDSKSETLTQKLVVLR
ncbi:MAG: C25 family cysteine peptidase [Bacteroidota bacterium]|nr:C25 family cysteine peptidase [Bacteroidota bacterium]